MRICVFLAQFWVHSHHTIRSLFGKEHEWRLVNIIEWPYIDYSMLLRGVFLHRIRYSRFKLSFFQGIKIVYQCGQLDFFCPHCSRCVFFATATRVLAKAPFRQIDERCYSCDHFITWRGKKKMRFHRISGTHNNFRFFRLIFHQKTVFNQLNGEPKSAGIYIRGPSRFSSFT